MFKIQPRSRTEQSRKLKAAKKRLDVKNKELNPHYEQGQTSAIWRLSKVRRTSGTGANSLSDSEKASWEDSEKDSSTSGVPTPLSPHGPSRSRGKSESSTHHSTASDIVHVPSHQQISKEERLYQELAELEKEVEELEVHVEKEEKDNEAEKKRRTGHVVCYGDVVS